MTTAEKTKMTTTVNKSVDVHVPVSRAYNQWTQFESFPKFMHGVKEITQTDATHNHWIISIAGVKREFDTEITEQKPDQLISWASVDGKMHAGTVTFEILDAENTRIHVDLAWKPENLADIAGKILQLDDIQVTQDLKNFKELIEGQKDEETIQAAEGEGWRAEVIPNSETPEMIHQEDKSAGLFAEANNSFQKNQ